MTRSPNCYYCLKQALCNKASGAIIPAKNPHGSPLSEINHAKPAETAD
ncbi:MULTISPECIES: hypothetical protein [Rickettsiella]|nr:hypothetical protein [Candidatus Rickettsiella isopodorum]MCH9754296.1 hypothetical protein [Gammaproteobacteria bacterium]MDD4893416.1 hypothetical protein [Candidatus Rickettsiella isopodorum]MDD5162331.1 hypothetical protein [Candidatus Rickettsiella isopodorum]